MTANSSVVSGDDSGGGGGVNSPSSRRTTLTSPWAQVVRGVIEPESVPTSPAREVADPVVVVDAPPVTVTVPVESQPERCNAGNAGEVKPPVWNKPPVDVVEATVAPVMGADLWPALSESTRPGAKSISYYSSESSSKPVSDISSAPVISQPPPKHVKPNNANNARQKQIRRGGNTGGVSASYTRPAPPPPMPPPFPLLDIYGNLVPQPPPILESPQVPFKGNNWSPRSVDPNLNRNPGRRNNFGPRPVNNGGGRRDHHDRDWRGPRSHQMGPPPPPPPPLRGFIRGPAPFIPHQPLRPPFGVPVGYDMGASYVYLQPLPQEPYRGVTPLLPHGPPGPMYMPATLREGILQQIEYYFCDANLVKDNYLKSQMDEEGWVSIALIAGFRRVQTLTMDIQMIMNSLIDSSIVEVQGDKVRRRNDWRNWLLTSSESPRESTNNAIEEASLQKLKLEDCSTNENKVSDSPKLANGEVSSSEDHCS